jgi:hypothetical protein
MKRFLTVIALTCVLSSSALAGDIPSVGKPSPAPAGTSQTTTSTSPGEIPSGGSAEQISDAALSTLLSVFSFLAA